MFTTRVFTSYDQFAYWAAKIGSKLLALDGQYATAEWHYADGTTQTMTRQSDTRNQTGCHVLKWATSNMRPSPGHRAHAKALDERGGGSLTITFVQ